MVEDHAHHRGPARRARGAVPPAIAGLEQRILDLRVDPKAVDPTSSTTAEPANSTAGHRTFDVAHGDRARAPRGPRGISARAAAARPGERRDRAHQRPAGAGPYCGAGARRGSVRGANAADAPRDRRRAGPVGRVAGLVGARRKSSRGGRGRNGRERAPGVAAAEPTSRAAPGDRAGDRARVRRGGRRWDGARRRRRPGARGDEHARRRAGADRAARGPR
jgi:hypothetical protein